ncbi:MAG TPA: hypothetical protein VMV86_01825, partial [Methanosarcinales archaeon]|nr:hypothetical protein [Methanosarcinales archaeon]
REQLSFIELQAKALERKNKQLEREKQILNETHVANIRAVNEQQRSGQLTGAEATARRTQLIEERATAASGIDSQYLGQERAAELLRELIETTRLSAREQMSEDRRGVERIISEDDRRINAGRDDESTAEDALIRGQQRDLLGNRDSGGNKSIFRDVLAANLVSELLGGVAKTIQQVGTAQNEDVLTPKGFGLAAKAPGYLAAAIVNPISEGGSAAIMAVNEQLGSLVDSLVGIHLEKAKELQIASNRLIAVTGRGTKGGLEKYGYNSAQAAELELETAQAAGKSSASSRAGQVAILEKGVGLDKGTIMQMLRDTRITGNNADMIKNVAQVVSMIPSLREDRTKLQETLSLQSSFIQQQGQNLESVDRKSVTAMMATFDSIGGRFSKDPAHAMKVMQSVNQSLSNPQGDFAQARNFQVLQKLNPNASYVETMKMQEQGILQGGFLEGTLGQLKRETGGGDGLTIALKQMTGLSMSTAEKVAQAFEKDPDKFKGFKGTDKDLDKMFGVKGEEGKIKAAGENLTSSQEKSIAEIGSAFATSFVDGFKVSMDKNMEKLQSEADKFVEEKLKKSKDSLLEKLGLRDW